jgi:hypothetical protein
MIMKVKNLKETCGGCPTVYEWENAKGIPYYFRLRHGWARICKDNSTSPKISGDMDGFDGVCNFNDVKKWAKSLGLKLKEI